MSLEQNLPPGVGQDDWVPRQLHTPEPWVVSEDLFITNTGLPEDEYIAIAETKSDARRIVACVNACAGLETEFLETPGIAFMAVRQTKEIAKLQKQHDQLLAALATAKMALNVGLPEYSVDDALDIINDAIAAAEGGNKS